MVIKRVSETDDRAGQFINEAFTDYAIKSNVDLNERIKTNRSIISHHNHYHVTYLLRIS